MERNYLCRHSDKMNRNAGEWQPYENKTLALIHSEIQRQYESFGGGNYVHNTSFWELQYILYILPMTMKAAN